MEEDSMKEQSTKEYSIKEQLMKVESMKEQQMNKKEMKNQRSGDQKPAFHDKKTEQGGYLTVEITMIFSVLFFSLILILFMGMVLYQEVNLQSVAVRASERGSVVYSSRVSDMTSGTKTLNDFLNRDPYRNVPFMDGGKKEYSSVINQYVNANLGKRDVISGTIQNTGNYVTVEDYMIEKRIKVSIQGGYKMPMDSIPEMFGMKGPFQVNPSVVSVVTDSPDFVRNVDLAMDVAKQTEIFGKVEEGYNKIRDAIDKVKNLLK